MKRLFVASAAACLIRKSTFHESDGQWHSGWTNENLFELCTIGSKRGHGGSGGTWPHVVDQSLLAKRAFDRMNRMFRMSFDRPVEDCR